MANEVIERKANLVSTQCGQSAVAGIESFNSEDLTLPRIRLLQSLSQEVDSGEEKAGTFKNSITGENYGERLDFIPISVQKGQIRFVDRELKCKSIDGATGKGDPGGACATCDFAQWNGDEPPQCMSTYDYLSLVLDKSGQSDGLPIFISFSKTSMSAGRKLNTMAKFDTKGSVYELYSEKKESPKGRFYVMNVRRKRSLTPEELETIIGLREMFAGKSISVDHSIDDVDTVGTDLNKEDDEQPF